MSAATVAVATPRRRGSGRLVAVRVLVAAAQVAAVSLIVLVASTVLPGDTAEIVLGQQASPEQIATLRDQLGLDRPVLERFADWVGGALTGDLGRSLVTGVPVSQEARVPGREHADPRGRRAAGHRPAGRRRRRRRRAQAGQRARPGAVGDRHRGAGRARVRARAGPRRGLRRHARLAAATAAGGSLGGGAALVLPVAVLAANQVGRMARQIRIGVVETDRAEHVVHLRHLGLGERVVLWRHVLPGAVLPSVQQLARVVDGPVGGVVVVEALFALPGVGAGFVEAVGAHDLPLVQAYAVLFALTTVVVNLVADLVSERLSPQREVLA